MIQELIGKEVEVIALDIVYRGILVEVGETEVYLHSESGWITIPVANIAEIRIAK
jgi:hypothetical protein